MKTNSVWTFVPVLAGLLWMGGCTSRSPETAEANAPLKQDKSIGEKLRDAVASEVELPAGTELQVRLGQSVGSAGSDVGQKFDGTLHTPLVLENKVVVPKGAVVKGHVTRAVASGHLRTPARLSVTLDTLEWDGKSYAINTSTVSRSARSHNKRNLALIGGGSGAGALIGGLAGGGKGALIGAGAGAAAGTAGAYATGKKNVVLPAESLLTFRLQAPVKVKK